MSALRNLPISRKLLFGFGSVCLLTAVLGTVALISFHRINANVDDIVSNSMPSVKVLADIRTNAAAIRRTDGNACGLEVAKLCNDRIVVNSV